MRNRIIYIIFLLALIACLYLLNKEQPQNYTWTPTYDTDDKQPYGAYALDKLLKTSWKSGYTHSYQSISDLKKNGKLEGSSLLIIAESFHITGSEMDTLFAYIREGGTALIAARYFDLVLEKKLNFHSEYELFGNISILPDTARKYRTLRFCTPNLCTERYKMPAVLCSSFFTFDSLEKIKGDVFIAVETNDTNIVMLRYPMGKGSLLLSCNPLIYTNYGILSDDVNGFIFNSLSYLRGKPLIRTEYYDAGSNAKESKSILRYLLSKPPLRWALNISIIAILLFMFFTAKRKQKAIPVVKPPKNRMLDFVRSVANLYIQKNNNADIILKKQIFWADSLKRSYGIDIINERHDIDFYERLAVKTNKSVEQLQRLFNYLDKIDENTQVSDAAMMEAITQMNAIK